MSRSFFFIQCHTRGPLASLFPRSWNVSEGWILSVGILCFSMRLLTFLSSERTLSYPMLKKSHIYLPLTPMKTPEAVHPRSEKKASELDEKAALIADFRKNNAEFRTCL